MYFLHFLLLASTYGASSYDRGVYATGPNPAPLVQIGPLSLPNTGAGWAVIVGAVLLAVTVGVSVWMAGRRKRRQAPVA